MHELLALRDLAVDIARSVGPIAAAAQPRVPQARAMATQTKSNEVDLVTELDHATEAAIVRAIATARPRDGVLGEEGAASPSQSGYVWIIDPIDGTVNYFYGLPSWAISLGVADTTGEPVVGVVHAPALDETYVAARGHGAFLVHADVWVRLQTPPAVPIAMALLATGFPYNRDRRKAMGAALADLIPRVRDVRRIGSAALDICSVAAGRIDGYYERDTQLWDRAAAFVVAREVGLAATTYGDEIGENLSIVALPALAAELRAELAQLGVVD